MGFLGKKTNTGGVIRKAGTTLQRGQHAEDEALAYLISAGMLLVERNYRTPGRGGGEIDLVMRERDGTLVFVEVRSRATSAFGGAAGSVGRVKQQRLVRAAQYFLMRWSSPPACRFDVISIEDGSLQWLRAAFDAG
jgi:putative endonuclease